MLGRRGTKQAEPPAADDEAEAELRAAGKGHATPKRSTAQAQRRTPLVGAKGKGTTAQRSREERRETYQRTMSAYQTEDQRFLPLRDRGPVRRYVRDLVDRRRNVAEFFLPVAVIVLALGLVPSVEFRFASGIAMYTVLGVLALDSFLLWRTVGPAVRERFGTEAEGERGLGSYAVLRAFQMRRMRRPVPQIRRGQAPR